MNGICISTVTSASDTETRDISVEKVLEGIRTGGKKLKGQVEQIRNRFEAELDITGDLKAAKRAIAPLKVTLPGVIWTGQYSNREHPAADKLQKHSGLFVGDLDDLGERLPDIRKKLKASPHVFAAFLSPSGNGLKVVVRVPADASKHPGSFRAVKKLLLELTGIQIDESGKDLGRLCFMSYDPDLYVNWDAVEIEPLPEPEKPKPTFNFDGEVSLSERMRTATEMFGPIGLDSDTHGFLTCPGKHLHTQQNLPTDCQIHLDGAPNIHCYHTSCKGIITGVNHELQSRIGHTESAQMPKAKTANEQGEAKPGATLRPPSAATELVRLSEGFEFFHDQQDRPFVRLEINDHREVWPVESTKFRKLLARAYYKKNKKAINRNSIGDAITTLAGKACHDGGEEPVFLRIAPHGKDILIDLCDTKWRVVEVTTEGWRILDHSPVAFIRTGSMQALPEPIHGGGDIKPLWKLLNVSEAQRPLVAGSLLNAYHPDGPYFVTNYVGEHGVAKSCAARIERQLVDPSSNPLRSPPKEERDLISQAASNRVVALDNLSYLPSWLSDAICRLATGGGHSARTLYTDLEEISLAIKRPVFLNGIEDVAVRPDLADRALQIELEQIPEENRMLEEDLWPELEKRRPTIFTAILDALSCALKNRLWVKKKYRYLPRMADAVIWVTAGETSFGFERGTFLKAYAKNLDESAAAAIELNPAGLAITQLLEKQDEWSGTPAQLLEALDTLVSDEQKRKTKEWPQNARTLGHALRRLAPALRRGGIGLKRQKVERHRVIVLTKTCKVGKRTSTTSHIVSSEEKPEKGTSSQNVSETAKNVSETAKNVSETGTSSPTPLGRDDVDDVDDVFPTLHIWDKPAPEAAGDPVEPDAVDL